jgi:hypothetical protein
MRCTSLLRSGNAAGRKIASPTSVREAAMRAQTSKPKRAAKLRLAIVHPGGDADLAAGGRQDAWT